ncbi:transcriptional regulator, TetR family [Kribbella flavida DSM 17836]|uniref:Transcriptional regulator, TetR family n=1 Tax=Kribbella flavida (strain DSM 17836 / JCM 10339 / NBRC 14399) TaxID=479435 RepID=D2PW95_KRIFD|nr:TetR/AcrR family transcriptional regulator [Kribbella flavida]ADB31547.1 transcriptional regulator, TetR family [Kribbella flavida DSM 17836]
MPRARSGDTKARIQAVALELFASKGLQQTSLRDIADQLGMTKPALYYHFASRDELVRSLAIPLIDDMTAFLAGLEASPADPRELLGAYFDVTYRHRVLLQVAIRDLSVLQQMDLTDHVFDWRRRIVALLIGPSPSLEHQVRGMVALGGLSDCTVAFEDVDVDELRTAAVAAAYDALRPGVQGMSAQGMAP